MIRPVFPAKLTFGLIAVFAVTASVNSAAFQDDQNAEESGNKLNDSVLQLTDAFEFEFGTDPQIAPDGRQIVYVRNSFDIMTDRRVTALWTITGAGEHLPLFSGTASYSSPRWSADGRRLAYVTNEQGSSQIHCYWTESRRHSHLTRLAESPSGITWSPDGNWLAFVKRVPAKKKPYVALAGKPKDAKWADPPEMITRLQYRSDGRGFLPQGFTHLFVVSAAGGTPRQITAGEFNHGGSFCWSNDSKSIIFSANRNENHEYDPRNSEIYEVDIRSREVKQLTNRKGPDGNPRLSADGSRIAYVGFDDKLLGYQNSNLYVMNRDGTESKCLTPEFDRSVGSIEWNEKLGGVVFQYDDSGNTRIALAKLDGQIVPLAENVGGTSVGRPYSGGSYSIARDGTIAFTLTSTRHPAEIARVRPGSQVETLTALNDDLFTFKKLGAVEEIQFHSSHDQVELEGWIIKPPEFDANKKYPLILEIHGGPFANYGTRFTGELQLMAAQGYVVFYMNPRGSTSYGEKFANYIHHNYPGNDYDDLMSGVDAVIAKGYIDTNNLFVTGGSGGGVLTSWIIGKTNRFRAAVVAKPVINWYSFSLTADAYNVFYKYWFPGFPWDYPEQYMARSPISLVGNVTTPTMLLTGTEDYRTPMSETEQFYQALKLRKIDAAMVRIPGASHGITARPSRLLAKVAYILKWFENHKYEEESTDDERP